MKSTDESNAPHNFTVDVMVNTISCGLQRMTRLYFENVCEDRSDANKLVSSIGSASAASVILEEKA